MIVLSETVVSFLVFFACFTGHFEQKLGIPADIQHEKHKSAIVSPTVAYSPQTQVGELRQVPLRWHLLHGS